MPHTVLYRKKRPRTFDDVVGQKHVLRAICNQVKSGQLSHAYLFCGTRGTGKTSIARILARAVNCENPQNGNPCNICESCASIFAERNLNVVEIDAASNNGVENIRDLRDDVKYQPAQGQYKVYIIDEVHMLSNSAFNALLKTLEEPPSHVIFILATTDQQKLPATILSRCQRYDFRRIPLEDMITTLKKYLHETKVEFEDSALDYIAYHSDGAMRDALSLLDQSLSLNGDKLTYAQVLDMLGAVDRARLFEFTDALNNRDSGAVMSVINTAMDGGRDASQFVTDLIRHFRDVLVASLVDKPDAVDFSAEIAESLREQGRRVPASNLMEYIHIFSETLREMRFAPHTRTALEVCALKICSPRSNIPLQVSEPISPTPIIEKIAEKPPEKPSAKEVTNTTVATLDKIVAGWDALCFDFKGPLRAQCAQCGLENNDGKLQIIVSSEAMKNILKPKEGIIREAIANKFWLDTPPNIAFEVREGYNKPKTELQVNPKVVELNPVQPTLPDEWLNAPTEIAAEEPIQLSTDDWTNTLVEVPPDADEDDWGALGDVITDDN